MFKPIEQTPRYKLVARQIAGRNGDVPLLPSNRLVRLGRREAALSPRPRGSASRLRRLSLSVFLVSIAATPLHAQFVTDEEKTDLLLLRNGDWITGDFRRMERGLVEFKTDAASTIRVKWPRVLTATTDKIFDIHLADGSRWVGSLLASDSLGQVVVRATRDTFEVDTRSVVDMIRIKENFWKRLDGSIDFGFDFTQQNAKTDVYVAATVRYEVARNRFKLHLNGSFSRQDSVSNITRSTLRLLYAREIRGLWFVALLGSLEENSQLSLDRRAAIGGGPGRYFVLNSRMALASYLAIYGMREKFTGEEARNNLPLGLVTDFQFWDWSGLSSDIAARLSVVPILNDSGRWQIRFETNLTQEIVNLLYLRVGLIEIYDSKPPTNANKNDFSITTSLGFTF